MAGKRQLHVIAIDEKPKQIVSDRRKYIPMKPGSREKTRLRIRKKWHSKHICRCRTKNWKEDNQRYEKKNFTLFVKEVLNRYPKARKLHIILDNLNTHFVFIHRDI
jgi:hypothetical protein